MKIVGEFELAKEADKDAEAKGFLKQVYAQLKAKPGVGLKLDIEAKDRQEAASKVKKLNRLIKSMGAVYQFMVFSVDLVGDTGFEVKAILKQNTHKKSSKKKGGKKGRPSYAKATEGKAGGADAGMMELLKQVESGQIPANVLPGILKQYEQLIPLRSRSLTRRAFQKPILPN